MLQKHLTILLLAILYPVTLVSQNTGVIESAVEQSDVEMHVHFLAADEFLGRETGSQELDIAARYIATWFMSNGVQPFQELDEYYQTIPFRRVERPHEAVLAAGDSNFSLEEDFVILGIESGSYQAPPKVLNHGIGAELEEQSVEGRIVVVRPGRSDQTSPQQWFMQTEEKNRELAEAGAVAVIELYDHQMLPWEVLAGFLNSDTFDIVEGEDQLEAGEEGTIPHIWLNSTGRDLRSLFSQIEEDQTEISIQISRKAPERVTTHNVVGYIEGSDPDLKDEYLLLGAHYDHVGVADEPVNGNYIYNGARDNAVGTSAIMLAARYFAENPPARSVIFAAWTAEEIGLLGSNYFAENAPLPLEQIIYNLNIDGAGYNDTTKVTVIGLGRTEADEDLIAAAATFGLEAIPDPVPEQNLFDRSDNVNFARRGIPAPTYSLGLTAFDEEIERYYHTVLDEPHTVDYPYITQYVRSFILAAEKIANSEVAPFWIEGDVYEDAGRALYNMEVVEND